MNTRWEITILEFEDSVGKKFKVTRRIPAYTISETKIFDSKEKAQQQIQEWLDNVA